MKHHTPGPWTIPEESRFGEIVAQKPGQKWPITVARTEEVDIYTDGWSGSTEANARLIAAAPELLGACQAAIAYDKAIRGRAQAGDFEKLDPRGAIAEGVDLDTLYEEWITLSMCAIAKAEGRP